MTWRYYPKLAQEKNLAAYRGGSERYQLLKLVALYGLSEVGAQEYRDNSVPQRANVWFAGF